MELFRKHHIGQEPVRSLSVKASGLTPADGVVQLSLFPEVQKAQRRADIDRALDKIPLHLSRFFPRYQMTDRPPTPVEQVYRLAEAAQEYLSHVCESVGARLREQNCLCSTVSVGIRDNRLLSYDRQAKLDRPTANTLDIWETAVELMEHNPVLAKQPVQEIHVGLGQFPNRGDPILVQLPGGGRANVEQIAHRKSPSLIPIVLRGNDRCGIGFFHI